MLGQLGLKRTKEKRGSNAEGPRYTRIGEMVTMDCWKTDIVVLLKKLGIWMRLSRRQKKEWGVRRRVWVCVAMDVSNRKVVGIGFGLSESPELTRRVLRMVGSGTSEEASVVGCQSPPSSGIGIEILATDSGVAFRHGFFTSSALSLVDQLKVGIVGQPWRQAMKERLFRTTKEQALPYFSGLSFGNPVARGDFDAMADASNTLCVFGNGLFRYFFDVYHMSGHRGLDGQPPKNRFDDALEATGMKPAPTDAIRLIAFGLERELPLTSQGLTHMGIEYKAVWLADIFKKRVATTMRVKVDPCDLGHLGVLWDDEWQIVDASPEFFGVGATLWRQKREELARRYGQQAEINFPIVAQALRDTKANADRERLELKWRIRHMTARDYRQKLTASS